VTHSGVASFVLHDLAQCSHLGIAQDGVYSRLGRYPVRHDYPCWDGQMVEAEKEKKMKELEKKQKALERHAISPRY
jgi:hypothetical protein